MPINSTSNSVLVTSPAIGGRAVVRVFGTCANIIVASNSTVNANISTSNETITGATLTGLTFSLTGNSATISRSVSNAANVFSISGSGIWNTDLGWHGEGLFPSANLIVTYGAGASSVVYLELT